MDEVTPTRKDAQKIARNSAGMMLFNNNSDDVSPNRKVEPVAGARTNSTIKILSKQKTRKESDLIQRLSRKSSIVVKENTLELQEVNESARKWRNEALESRQYLMPVAVGKQNVNLNHHIRRRSLATQRKVPKLKNTEVEQNDPLALSLSPREVKSPRKKKNQTTNVTIPLVDQLIESAELLPLAEQDNPPIQTSMRIKSIAHVSPLRKDSKTPVKFASKSDILEMALASPIKVISRSSSVPVAGKKCPKATLAKKCHLHLHKTEEQPITKLHVNDHHHVNQDAAVATTNCFHFEIVECTFHGSLSNGSKKKH